MGSATLEKYGGVSSTTRVPVDSLPLSNRTRTRLLQAGITTLDQLLAVSDDELLGLRGFGHVCLREVRSVVRVLEHNESGSELGMTEESFPSGVSEPLASTPIDKLPISNRARRVFQREGIRTVSDYVELGEGRLLRLRNFGSTSLVAVNRAIHSAMRTLQSDESSLNRFQSAESLSLRPELLDGLAQVPVAALDLPRRARRACQEMRLRTLKDLADISTDDLLVRRNFGQATLRRIQREVERFLADHDSLHPQAFCDIVQQLLGRLQEKERMLVELREGRHGSPMTLTDAGRRMDITESRACQIEHSAWHKLRRFGAGVTDTAAEKAVGILMQQGGVASPDVLTGDEYFAAGSLGSSFTGRMLTKLLPHRLARLADGRLAAAPAATLYTVAARLRKRLRRSNESQSLDQLAGEVLRGLDLGPEGSALVQALCEALFSREVAKDADGLSLVRTPVQGLGDDLRRVLERAGQPLHFRDIARRLEAPPFCRNDLTPEKVRLRLCRDPRFILVQRGLYDLVERFRVDPELARRIADHAHDVLLAARRPTSVALLSAELRECGEYADVSEFVLAAVLREDERFRHLGRGTFVTRDRAETDVHHVSEILESILREAGGPLAYSELRRRVRELRQVSDGAISATLVGRRTFLRVARGRFDLAERYPFDDDCRERISRSATELLTARGGVESLDELAKEIPREVARIEMTGVLLGDIMRRQGGFRFLPGGFAYLQDEARERTLAESAADTLRRAQEPLRPTTIARRLDLDGGMLALLRDLVKSDPRFQHLPDGRVALA